MPSGSRALASKLTVLPAKMNPDLAMGDELLKKTGAGNLFMVFGEPDVEIRPANPLHPPFERGKEGVCAQAALAQKDFDVALGVPGFR